MMDRFQRVGGRVVSVLRREDGATAVEYALMLALIAAVIVVAVTMLGQSTSGAYSDPTLVNTLGS